MKRTKIKNRGKQHQDSSVIILTPVNSRIKND